MIQPQGEYIVIQRIQHDNVSEGGIIMAGESGKQNDSYKVLAVGDEVTKFAVGNEIMLSKYGESKLYLKGKEISFALEKDVFAVVLDDTND